MEKLMKCCICGKNFRGYGNNPDGAVWKDKDGNIIEPTFNEEDRCCNECDDMFVIPGRIYRYMEARGKVEKLNER